LALRQDNADARLTPIGREMGLVDDSRWGRFLARQEAKATERQRLHDTILPPSETLNSLLTACGTTPVSTGIRLEELLKRPQLSYAALAPVDPARPALEPLVVEQLEVELKYEGYIRREQAQIEEMRRLENRLLPADAPYEQITGLRKEAQEKLAKIRPRSIGQASRISGVSPADVSVLIIWSGQQAAHNEENAHDGP
jgi:tRNA uridine 5-carboxymethylaminomethyl modification enzyme